MSASKLEPSTLLNPTTCFTIACVAFSLVALSAVWRNSKSTQATPTSKDEEEVPSRPQPQRRVAADSLYAETRDEDVEQEAEKPAAPQDRQSQIAELILLSARVAQLLRTCQQESAQARMPIVDLLNEISILTTLLCRVQQEILINPAFLGQETLSACYEATSSSLQATLLSQEAALNSGIHSLSTFLSTTKHLKDQRPMLEFLLESASANVLPTPPSETALEASLAQNAHLDPSPSLQEHTGITPSLDDSTWSQPPPYSPPSKDSSPAFSIRSDEKVETPATVAISPEREDSPNDGNALYDAVNENDSEALMDLLAEGADPSRHFGDLQRTALHQAAHHNYCACLVVLLRHGAVMSIEDAKGDTALHLAAWAGNVEALSTLLAHGADVDWLSGRDGYSPLWCAISAYQIDAARLLLKHGARLSLRSASGTRMMPLHQAAVTGQSAMCELLLDRGAQVDCVDDDLNTPLHYGAAAGSVSSVKVLLRSGADIEARQIHGLTPVSWASHKGHTEVLELLLGYGARLDCTADGGATPLHLAANRGHTAAVRLLLEKGASRKSGRASWDGVVGTPAEMAKAKGHARLARLLQK
ncbi:hypothetical protein PRZ48_001083 [Zasmidium cellare]|uniref:Ankyrin repeat protein n=1 Tax=Zasmidium cellare TaxID=395010 RepID=A0ABR0F1M6_ZASCE|nr:hypothetical protein PRZ48_001083 [Zasmidium cellare]